MRWRTAAPADDKELHALIETLYLEDPSTVPMTSAKIDRTIAVLRREPARGTAIVLDVGGRVFGYALLCSFWSNELGGEVCIIDELYVSSEQRGQGAAGALVRGLVDGSLPWFADAVAIELEVTPDNLRARALYERLGFVAYKNALMRVVR
jgi:GNAT superfamily N-acetyltransferase